ncbi:MAG TPA: response regulator [Elusimicrobiales bacterium]|nr:response regulator [Elusimicrobiales bacterium]
MRGKILLVDDNEDLLFDFKLWFEEYDITGAASAGEALALLARPNEFDLVILDVQMPGMDGLAALDKIKELAPEKRVIIMTAFSTKDVAIHALTGKADNYVEKPFDLKTMRAAIEKELLAKTGAENPGDMDVAGKIEHVRRFLEGNCFKKVTLKDAAAVVFLTPKYLSRLFRQQAGMSFSRYKLSVKMDQAKRMLRTTGRTIKQVSAKLGYANAESFIRQFEKLVRTTPSSYRNTHRSPR